jgi:hypothetical protein
LSEFPLKDPAPADDAADAEPRPGRIRKPIGWSMIVIAVLVADFGATIAMVVSWTLIGYGRAVAWELPIMGTDFTLWRIVISLPLPVLAGALGRFVYVRMYPKAAE